MLRFESFVFTCLTYRNVQCFRNGPVHEFYGLKASQMSNVRASSHEYPQVEKSRIFENRISKVRLPTLTSKQKEKPHGKNNNRDLTAKEIRIKMSSRFRRNVAASLFLFAVRLSFCFDSFSFCCEVFLFAASLFLFAARWGYSFCRESFSFCREVNAFAVTVVVHRTKVRQTTSNWIVRILYKATCNDSCIWNILILVFAFVVFNTARIGPYCNTKPKSLFLERYYSFGVDAPSIWSCAPKIFNSAPKISAVRLKIYTWSHKCSQSQK